MPYRMTAQDLNAAPAAVIERRESIARLEEALKSPDLYKVGLVGFTDKDPQAQPILHQTKGILVREYRIAKGTVLVGKRHAQEHICIVSAGRILVTTENGAQEISAPCHFVSPAGSKRAMHALEDTVWTTIHRTDALDIESAEAELIIAERLEGERLCLGQ
jgi:quercetin dioxygenase-like cupin family protein